MKKTTFEGIVSLIIDDESQTKKILLQESDIAFEASCTGGSTCEGGHCQHEC